MRTSPRPRSKYAPEEWRSLSVAVRAIAEKKEKVEKEKAAKESSSSKDKTSGKKKKKTKSLPKMIIILNHPDDTSAAISLRKFAACEEQGLQDMSPSSAPSLSTDLPTTAILTQEWDEWSEIENGSA